MVDIYERIAFELSKRGLYRADLCRETGISEGTIRGWKRGSIPAADVLYEVAKYFGVSCEYLITGETSKGLKEYTTYEEQELLRIYKELPEGDKNTLLTLAKTLEKNKV